MPQDNARTARFPRGVRFRQRLPISDPMRSKACAGSRKPPTVLSGHADRKHTLTVAGKSTEQAVDAENRGGDRGQRDMDFC